MKKSLFLLFSLLFLLSSCAPEFLSQETFTFTEDALTQDAEEVSGTVTEEENALLTKEENPITSGGAGEAPGFNETHTHAFTKISEKLPDCIHTGETVLSCSCGESKVEIVPALGHLKYKSATCTTPSVCTRCGTIMQTALGHNWKKDKCTRCSFQVTNPIFVLGKEIGFDESALSIQTKLGPPSQIIREGDLVSLVYAGDLRRLTVIQTDSHGLWGVFTMDREAILLVSGTTFTIASFSGNPDPNSNATYRDVDTCRIFGFRDQIGGDNYALWLHYSECEYNYMQDVRLYADFSGQNTLSYYFVNALRARHDLAPLTWSDGAGLVAKEYSAYMIEAGFFDHDNSFGERLKQKGIFWRYAGENISQGYINAYFVTDAYYNSPDHRVNILSPHYTHLGVGYHMRVGSSVYGAQIFYS